MLRTRVIRLVASVALVVGLSACTPQQAITLAFGDRGPEVVDQAMRVAGGATPRCPNGESTMNPRAVNGSHVGLFQLSTRYHSHRFGGGDPFDPLVNALAARSLYDEQGWGPWSCRP